MLPSGFNITIREQNGDDDDIISQITASKDGTAIPKFLAGIIIESENKPSKKLTYLDILDWKIKDIYYALLVSRIHSLDNLIDFEYECINSNCKRITRYEEDLDQFTQDFTLPAPTIDEPGYFKYRVTPYENGAESIGTLKLESGKEVEYTLLTGKGENLIINLEEDKLTKNQELISRYLRVRENPGDPFQTVGKFDIFSAKEMRAIRSEITKNDTPWLPYIECICPYCKTKSLINMVQEPAFYYPLEK